MEIPNYLAALNPEQKKAVLHWEDDEGKSGKNLLILAGAGSGKTRVITSKIAYLIRERGLRPSSILAVTFTNKAAREMAERARSLEPRAEHTFLKTFHSFGAWFLRINAKLAGLNPEFVIYDEDDSVSLLASFVKDKSKADLRLTAHQIARAKDYFLSPDDPDIKLINYRKEFQTTYKKYEERLKEIGNIDFGDLIKKPVEILRANPLCAEELQNRFRVIMIDEYQDTNTAQFTLLKELCGEQTYICVVGDDDQSIYRFRGAEVRNILEFPEKFPNTDIIRLEKNYRSTAPILKVASSVVKNNAGRLGKTLSAERGDGKTPVLAFLPNQDEETAFAAQIIESSVNSPPDASAKKASYADWAILYRTNAQSLGFETELLRRGIPFRVVGSLKFYEREEIKDALALLSFLANPRDEIAFRRIINKPSRGVGETTISRIIEEAEKSGSYDLLESCKNLAPSLAAKARAGLTVFINTMKSGRAALADSTEKSAHEKNGLFNPSDFEKKKREKEEKKLIAGEGLSFCVAALAQNSGIVEYHLAHDEIAGNQRVANLQELVNAASLYSADRAGLLEFLEHIEIDSSMQKEEGGFDAVTLITIHNTKGLEFRRVIITGVEQGVFPRDDKKDEDLEEERRLFYVGVTRAMDELYLTSCAARRVFGHTESMEPSIFLKEADRDSLRIVGNIPRSFHFSSFSHSAKGFKEEENVKRSHFNEKKEKTSPYSRAQCKKEEKWSVGDRLFSEDNGYGAVIGIRDHKAGPILVIRFDTGREMSLLSRHQGSKIVKVSEE